MPKRITVTLPNPIYEALGELAKVRDKPAATLAAEAVESLIEQAKRAKELPPMQAEEQPQ